MTNSVQLTNFTDFDRLLGGKNLLVTVIGSSIAFVLNFLQIAVPVPFPPYNLTFSLAFMIFVGVYTANIASASLVVLIGSLGMITPDGSVPEYYIGYLVINLLIVVLLSYYSNKLQLVLQWNRWYHIFALLFSIISITVGFLFRSELSLYTTNGVNPGFLGDLGTGIGLPLVDIGLFVVILITLAISTFILRGQIQLTSSSARKYAILGKLFIVVGQLVTIGALFIFSVPIDQSTFNQIARSPSHFQLYSDYFSYGSSVGIIGSVVNIFQIMAVTVTLTSIGISLVTIGKYRGNLEGSRGGSNLAYFAAPFAFLLYFILSSFYVQNILSSQGLFISIELFPIAATMIWSLFLINQIIARILLYLVNLVE